VLWLGASLVFVSIHLNGELMDLFARMFHRHYFFLCKKVALYFSPPWSSKTTSALQCNYQLYWCHPPTPTQKRGEEVVEDDEESD
jgi:hypothetical protein